jgi:mRNA-degrading endonuclease toxin of MazEF toxin-antitoxin module
MAKNLAKMDAAVKIAFPFELYLGKGTGSLPKNSKVKADQIRTLDKSRLVKLIGELGETEIEAMALIDMAQFMC